MCYLQFICDYLVIIEWKLFPIKSYTKFDLFDFKLYLDIWKMSEMSSHELV